MIYSQLRENERTARFEVRVIPGNKCQLSSASAEQKSETKTRTRKSSAASAMAAATPVTTSTGREWTIAERDEACWVDMEAELKRLDARAGVDLNLKTGESGGASAELILRLRQTLEKLYHVEHIEDYLAYLGLLNIFEYFRLIAALRRASDSQANADQLGIVGEEYFQCRKIALELDIAELTEWLVAHDIGLPNMGLFLPAEYKSDRPAVTTVAAPKRRSKKKASDTEATEEGAESSAPTSQLPDALFYTIELFRLHQATLEDLLIFVDDIKTRLNLESGREAILKIRDEAAPWLDVDHFETMYESMKLEEALATQRSHLAIQKQREIFEKKPKRGQKGKERRPNPRLRIQEPKSRTPLEEFEDSIDEDAMSSYERAMEIALSRPEGKEFLPDDAEEHEDEHAPVSRTIYKNTRELEIPAEQMHDHDDHEEGDHHEDEHFEPHASEEGDHDYHEDYQEQSFGFEEYPEGSSEMMEENEAGEEYHEEQGEQGGNGPDGMPRNRRRNRRRRGRSNNNSPQGGQQSGPHMGGPRGGDQHHGPQHGGNQHRGNQHNGPHGGAQQQGFNGPRNNQPSGRGQRNNAPQGQGGGRRSNANRQQQIDFDEMQPMTNDTPGLPRTSVTDPHSGGTGAPKRGGRSGGANKRRWGGKRR